ncbi:MAG: potassium transporter Kup [Bdellovibrionota bacterium]
MDQAHTTGQGSQKSRLLISLLALGVVFGDIGTSPLYAFRECFGPHHQVALNEMNILGVLSLIVWTLIVVICFKYITLILRADNNGEGGILSLMSLVSVAEKNRGWVFLTGLIGAALLFGDGIITPAISVLSAVEGLQILNPDLEHVILPLTIGLLVLLFSFQKHGTAKIGTFFGPIILVWFLTLSALGINGIIDNPEVLRALNPIYAIQFFMENGKEGFFILGSVFLVVTGGEALYADMGHFGRPPIQKAWFFVAFPALIINYFGQGALLLHTPSAISNPFYKLAPEWALIPVVIIATMATVIASQALISGVFSLAKQAMQLGYFPRMQIVHTSKSEIGQIYLPFMNWAMLLGVILLVIEFKSSSELASAYGVAVAGTAALTTILATDVALKLWGWKPWKVLMIFVPLLLVDLVFFTTNIVKFWSGGWVAIFVGSLIYVVMKTWQKGRIQLLEILKSRSILVEDFLKNVELLRPHRAKGYAIFMSGDAWGVPFPLIHNMKHNKVLHENIMLLTIKTKEVPTVHPDERIKIRDLGPNFHRVRAYFGFMEKPNIYLILKACQEAGLHFPLEYTTFVLGRETIVTKEKSFFKSWRQRLFALMSRNAERPMAFFSIPPQNVIEVGVQIEI